MAGGSITGVVGTIKWSYFTAAAIRGYAVLRTVTPSGAKWSLSARVVESDRFKMSQRPLVFVVPHARGVWSWPIVSYELRGDQLVAELGAVMEGHS